MTTFAENLNLTKAERTALESLTPEQIAAIRANLQLGKHGDASDDDAVVDAAAQYLADGGQLADLY